MILRNSDAHLPHCTVSQHRTPKREYAEVVMELNSVWSSSKFIPSTYTCFLFPSLSTCFQQLHVF
jgi:hypothetical protein